MRRLAFLLNFNYHRDWDEFPVAAIRIARRVIRLAQ